jgi:tRNA(Ile)-lysidine synthase
MGRSTAPDQRFAGIELRPRPDELPGIGRIVIAFSGGPDSVCLAALVAREQPRRPVICVHIDHQLDPESLSRSRRAEQIAAHIGLHCRIDRVRPDDRDGPEASARRARYRALAKELGPDGVLLTAHHADDQTETILLRLLRGAGPDGLAGIPVQRRFATGWIVRPLLDQPRERIMAWLEAQGLDWIEDPTNQSRRFDRNVLRRDIMPLLTRRWPGADRAIRRSGALSRGASEALAELADADLENCRESNRRLKLAPLRALSSFRRASAIRRWCLKAQVPPPPGNRLDELLAQIDRAQSDRCPELRWDRHVLRVWRERLWLDYQPSVAPDWSAGWRGDQPLFLPEPIGSLLLEAASPVRLPRVEVCLGVPGETLRLVGSEHRQAVKELMRSASIPPWQRALWPRLWRDGELLAVGGRWLAAGFSEELERRDCRLVWRSELAASGVH